MTKKAHAGGAERSTDKKVDAGHVQENRATKVSCSNGSRGSDSDAGARILERFNQLRRAYEQLCA